MKEEVDKAKEMVKKQVTTENDKIRPVSFIAY